jgi:hypothetical protein
VDTQAPSAELIYPAAGSSDVPVDARVTIQFAEAMSRTLGIAIGSGGKTSQGTTSWESGDTKIILTPSTKLGLGSIYWANLSGGSDLAGNHLPDCSWWFKTTAVPVKVVGSISGAVRDRVGNALSGVRVEAWENGSEVKASMSDSSGAYTLKDLEPGSYEVQASLSGYETYKRTVAISEGKPDVILDITLDPKTTAQAPSDPFMTSIGGVPLWLLIMLVALLLIVLLLVASMRRRRTEPGAGTEPSKTEEEAPKIIFAPTVLETKESVEKEEPPASEPETKLAEGEFECPMCGKIVKPSDRRCPGCKALIARG